MVSKLNHSDVTYLVIEHVLDLYCDEFDCPSHQDARRRLRSPNALEGALARPMWYAQLHGADLALQAAVLAHGIAEGQPFIDGNKRIALLTMNVFLMVNGLDLNAPAEELYRWMLRLSEGMSVDQLASLLRPYLVARP